MLIRLDEAVVYPEEQFTDTYGNVRHRPSTTGVTVRCMITANSSIRRAQAGSERQDVSSGWSFMSPDAPLGKWSRVEWRDRTFSVTNGPMPVGPLTASVHHVAALLAEEQ